MKGMNGAVQRALGTVREFTIAQRTLALIGVAVLVLGGVALTSWLGRPTYSPLFTGLSGSDASAVVAQLQKDKVDYQLSDGGATILVPVEKVDQERLAAAAAGLPSSDQNGYALLDDLGVTASEFQQNVTYQRAIQGELAKTIQSITGVTSASVQLAVPKQSVFTQNQQDPTASVFVNTIAPLSSAQVQAIVHLTSASVAGLQDKNVTVVDAKGNTLSAAGTGPTGSTSDATADYETRTKTAVQAMLDSVLGPGNSTVTVAADISASTGTKTTKSYSVAKGKPVLSESTDTSKYSGGGAAGAAGVLGSDTSTAQSTTGNGSGTYAATKGVKNNAIDETTTTQTIAAGTLNRQTIAVAVNGKATAMNPAQIQKLVAAAAGVNAARGDVVTVATGSFSTSAAASAQAALAQQQAAQAQDNQAKIIQSGIWVGGGLVGLVLLLLLGRKLFRKPAPAAVNGGDLPVLPRDPAVPGTFGAQLGGAADASSIASPFPAPPTVALGTMPTQTIAAARPIDGASPFADIVALAESDPERTAEFLMAMMSGAEDA
jgi:flagellar M-ring protein FliF